MQHVINLQHRFARMRRSTQQQRGEKYSPDFARRACHDWRRAPGAIWYAFYGADGEHFLCFAVLAAAAMRM